MAVRRGRDLIDLDRKTCSQKEGVNKKLDFLCIADGRILVGLCCRRKGTSRGDCVGLGFFVIAIARRARYWWYEAVEAGFERVRRQSLLSIDSDLSSMLGLGWHPRRR